MAIFNFKKNNNNDSIEDSEGPSNVDGSQFSHVSTTRPTVNNKSNAETNIEQASTESASYQDVLDNEKHAADVVLAKADEIRRKHWYDGFVRLFVWYPSDLPAEEKKLLFKLDVILLLYICASYFTKALDKSNIVKAYNANLDVDIDFKGNDLSYAKSLYNAGYIISMCLGTVFVTRPKFRFMLPLLETIWGILTFCEAAVKNSSHVFALRFLIGLAEGPIFPSVVYTIGSWYKRDEVYRRVMVFSVSSALGGMFSGFLQTAAFKTLDGVGGLAGWKWGFIIDGIITVPVALLGFIFYPGSLDQAARVWWLKDSEYLLCKRRMLEAGVRPAKKLSFSVIKRSVANWHMHYFAAVWVLLNVVALPDGVGFDLFLKSRPDLYSIPDRENYPAIQSAVGIVVQFIAAGLCDSFSPYIFLTIIQLFFIISYSSLVAWDIPIGYKWFCFMVIAFDGTIQAIISGQINRTLRRNAEERAFIIGYSDAVSQAMLIWTNIVFFPTSHAPRFRRGYIASLVGAILMLFLPILHYFGEKYDKKRYADDDLKAAQDLAHELSSHHSDSEAEDNKYVIEVQADTASEASSREHR